MRRPARRRHQLALLQAATTRCSALTAPDASSRRDRKGHAATRHPSRRASTPHRGQRRRETRTTRSRHHRSLKRAHAPGLCCRRPHPTKKALRHPADREVCLIPGRAVAGRHRRESSRRRRGGRPDDARDKSRHGCRLGFIFSAWVFSTPSLFAAGHALQAIAAGLEYFAWRSSRRGAREKNRLHDNVCLDGRRLPRPINARIPCSR